MNGYFASLAQQSAMGDVREGSSVPFLPNPATQEPTLPEILESSSSESEQVSPGPAIHPHMAPPAMTRRPFEGAQPRAVTSNEALEVGSSIEEQTEPAARGTRKARPTGRFQEELAEDERGGGLGREASTAVTRRMQVTEIEIPIAEETITHRLLVPLVPASDKPAPENAPLNQNPIPSQEEGRSMAGTPQPQIPLAWSTILGHARQWVAATARGDEVAPQMEEGHAHGAAPLFASPSANPSYPVMESRELQLSIGTVQVTIEEPMPAVPPPRTRPSAPPLSSSTRSRLSRYYLRIR